MSIKTDLLSLELICTVHKNSNMSLTYNQLVHKLQSHIPHFSWVAIYLYDHEKGKYELTAGAGDPFPLPLSNKSIMNIHMKKGKKVIGKFTVISRSYTSLDQSDYTSLKTLAQELSEKIDLPAHS